MKSVKVGSAEAKPGMITYGSLKVSELEDGTDVSIPVGTICGSEDGPRLWVHGALHGDEIGAVYALSKVFKTVNPHDLKGTLIALPITNILGFRAPQDAHLRTVSI